MENQPSGEGSSRSGVSAQGSESTVELNIKTLDSRIYTFHVDKNVLLSSFKEKIANEIGVPVGQQRLIFRGRVLKDDQHLSDYHVENGHTLHLVVRQPVQSQPPLSADSGVANGDNSNQANGSGHRGRVGQISHSVVLGTFNVGDQGGGVAPDLSTVIGSVLNSFGIGNQTTTSTSGAQPSVHLNFPDQTPQGDVLQGTHGTAGGQSQAGNQAQGVQAIPLQIPVPLPSVQAVPIPHSLRTLSEFINHMELAFTHSGDQPSPLPANTGDLHTVELPSDARGLPTVEALGVVLRRAQQLLNDHAVAELSRIAGRLENEGLETDPTIRGQIQVESMQVGLAMQHLGTLFLELGRTILTLRMGQSPAESFVNAGPAVYISALGPNPIMVQPFPLQTSSLFGSSAVAPLNPGTFGPVGIGNASRHINIHVHAGNSRAPMVSAVGTRPSNGEGVRGEQANGPASNNSRRQVVVPLRNIIASAVPSRSTGVPVSTAAQTGTSGSDGVLNESVGSDSAHRSSMAVSEAGQANVSLPVLEGEVQKVDPECRQVDSNAGSALSAKSMQLPTAPTSASASADAPKSRQNGNSSQGAPAVPLGLGLGGLHAKTRSEASKSENKSGNGTSSNPPISQNQHAMASGQQILQSLASSISSASRTNGNDQPSGQVPPVLGQIMGCFPSIGQGQGGQFDASNILSQVSQNLSGQTGSGSSDILSNMMGQLTQNPLIMNTVNQIAQQIDGQDLGNMISGLGSSQGGGIDLSRVVQQMMPIVSRALTNEPAFAEQLLNAENDAVSHSSELDLSGSDKFNDQIDLQHVTQRIERCNPPADIFHAMVETAQSSSNGPSNVDELCSDEHLANEYIEMLKRDLRERLQGDPGSGDKA